MATQVGHQRGQTVVIKTIEQFFYIRLPADVCMQSRAPCRAALISEHGELGIRTIFNPVFKRLSARSGESGTLQLAVL